MTLRKSWPLALMGLTTVALTTALLLLAPWPGVKAVAALALDVALPGWLLYRLVFRRSTDHSLLDAALWALGLGYAWTLLLTLGLHYVPGPFTRRWSLGAFDALLVVLLAASLRWPYEGQVSRLTRREWLWLTALTLAAGALRLINLSYSEFQGDEVAVLHKAAAAIQGRDDVLFLHRKGPAEILLPLLSYSQGMKINEWGARLPFTVASIAGVLAIYRLGVRGFGMRAGLWAGVLVALNGFFVAFGRIVQYQSLVLWFSVLGVLAAWAYSETRQRRYVWLSALFLALGLLCHTDAVFALLPIAWLILQTRPVAGKWWSTQLRVLLGPLLMGLALLAAFYLPYVASATFAQTAAYLSGRLGAAPPYNNLGHLLEIATVYNAVHYLALVGVVLVWIALRRAARATRLRWVASAALAALLAQAALHESAWEYLERDWLGLLFLVLVVLALIPSARHKLTRPMLLWFTAPFMLYMFLFQDPRTHVYTLFFGGTLLVGWQLATWQEALGQRGWLVHLATVPWLAAAAIYLVVALVSHQPEYKRTYPDHRLRAFWVPFGDEMPDQGLFGFPYRAGWKAVGQLYADGVLAGDYDSNEERHITRWYTRSQAICGSDPRYYFVAANVQDEQKIPRDTIAKDYTLVGRVWVGQDAKLEIYERIPAALTYRDYEAASLAGQFDRLNSGPWYDTALGALEPLAGMQTAVNARFGDTIELIGYAVDREALSTGQSMTVTLYWQALEPIVTSYTVFAHLEDPGVVWAQKDSVPRCGNAPTDEWVSGHVVVDRYALWLADGVPPGPHALVVGLYDRVTGQRLPVFGADGGMMGDALQLRSIVVQP